jgi:hypothetical protein
MTTMAEVSTDRVRANTAPIVNERIDEGMRHRVIEFANKSREEISTRIKELDEERDIERYLECNASALAFGGLLLGATVSRKWLLVPALVLPFLFMHGVQGWCPPVPLLRRLGVRTRREIDAEKYALRLLRGDFDRTTDPTQRAIAVLGPGG